MNKDVIEWYDTFNTKVCSYELTFGDFNDQSIPSDYYSFLSNDDENDNNVPGTPVDDALPDNKGVEDVVLPNDKDINY